VSAVTPEAELSKLAAMGRALRHRNYRLFFVGQSISLLGTWLSRVAASWLVYRLTNSALLLGIVGFVGQFPTFLLAPVAGVWTDRWNRHRALVLTQVLAMIQSGLLAFFALTGTISVMHIMVLSAFQGVINAFDMPVRQALVVEMVERREDLPNAIALNSSMFNAARLVGPSIAGVLIAATGEGMCFLIDALSYLAVIASLIAMRLRARAPLARTRSVRSELWEGLRYVAQFAPIRSILLLTGLVSLMGIPYTVLMPVMAKEILHGDVHTLALLMGASGCGALLGTLYLASRSSVLGLGLLIARMAALFGVGLIAFALSRLVWLSMMIMFVVGMSMMLQLAASNTFLQTIVEDDKRGRVMSFYTAALFGTAPLGSLIAGAVADGVGVPNTVLLGGFGCIAAALLFFRELPRLRAVVRPIYRRLGILPEIAEGIQSASAISIPPDR
jgi:MFS family permease